MEKSKMRENLKKRYKLENGQRIMLDALIKMSEVENIELKDLIFILGCYQNARYKGKNAWTTIGIKQKYNVREIIKLIKLDLKYLPQYGDRMYKKAEIEEICQKYNVSLEDFLTYIYSYKICYYENSYILEMNEEGLWIGSKIPLSANFLEKYYELLCRKIEKIADSMINLYSPKISKEELIDEGINCVLDHGKTEKNLAFDESKIIGKLLFKARYKMLELVINSYNKINLDDVIEFIKIENNMNQTNKIERWLYPIKLKRIEKLIIDTIQLNIESVIKNRTQGLNEINKKLNIECEKFYKNIEEIAQKLINQNKVRLCSDGKVVIINE